MKITAETTDEEILEEFCKRCNPPDLSAKKHGAEIAIELCNQREAARNNPSIEKMKFLLFEEGQLKERKEWQGKVEELKFWLKYLHQKQYANQVIKEIDEIFGEKK